MLLIIFLCLFTILIGWIIYGILAKLMSQKPFTLSSLIGKPTKVHTSIGPTPFDTGSIKFKGDVFPAITKDHIYIPKGTIVYISYFEGIRVVVSTAEQK